MKTLLALVVLILSGPTFAEDTFHDEKGDEVTLKFSAVTLKLADFKAMAKREYEEIARDIAKQGVLVIVIDRKTRGYEDIDRRKALNRLDEKKLLAHENFIKEIWPSSDKVTGGIHMPAYFDMPDEKGDFVADLTRPDRDKPIIYVAKNGSKTALLHEYLHHMIQEAAKRTPVTVAGNKVHPVTANLASIRKLWHEVSAIEKELSQKKLSPQEKKKKQARMGEIDLQSLELSHKADLKKYGEEMDINALLLDHYEELELPFNSLQAQSNQLTASYNELAQAIASSKKGPENDEIQTCIFSGLLDDKQTARYNAVRREWNATVDKLVEVQKWAAIRFEDLKAKNR